MEHFYQSSTYTITIRMNQDMLKSELIRLIEKVTGDGSVVSINSVTTKSSNTLIIVLSVLGGLLVLAVIIYFALFYKRGVKRGVRGRGTGGIRRK
jgi:membrane-anchored glycerophosphoryl diester phosphodiesterase (GDPDase)